MSAVAKRMLSQKIADGRRDRAVETLSQQLDKHVLGFFGKTRDVRSIRRADLEAFKAHLRQQGKAPQTINNLLTAVRQILKHAWKVDELLEAVPEVANVAADHTPKWKLLTPDQFDALIAKLDPRAREAKHYLLFIANTGLRKTEALAVRYSWIDWKERLLHIPAKFNKGGLARVAVYLNDVVLDILKERQANPPKRQTDSDRVFLQQKHDAARNSAAKRAKLGKVRNHDLRHTFGSLAHARGASLAEVRDMLGHRTLAMVNHYAHSYADRIKEITGKVQLGKAHAPGVPSSAPNESTSAGEKRPVSSRGQTARRGKRL